MLPRSSEVCLLRIFASVKHGARHDLFFPLPFSKHPTRTWFVLVSSLRCLSTTSAPTSWCFGSHTLKIFCSESIAFRFRSALGLSLSTRLIGASCGCSFELPAGFASRSFVVSLVLGCRRVYSHFPRTSITFDHLFSSFSHTKSQYAYFQLISALKIFCLF